MIDSLHADISTRQAEKTLTTSPDLRQIWSETEAANGSAALSAPQMTKLFTNRILYKALPRICPRNGIGPVWVLLVTLSTCFVLPDRNILPVQTSFVHFLVYWHYGFVFYEPVPEVTSLPNCGKSLEWCDD